MFEENTFIIISSTLRCVSSLKIWEIKDLPLMSFLQELQRFMQHRHIKFYAQNWLMQDNARSCFVLLYVKEKPENDYKVKGSLLVKTHILLTFLRHTNKSFPHKYRLKVYTLMMFRYQSNQRQHPVTTSCKIFTGMTKTGWRSNSLRPMSKSNAAQWAGRADDLGTV